MPYTIVIDAGHGGSDPGAVYEGRREKDDNLSLAIAVGELLSRQGVSVIYTRTTTKLIQIIPLQIQYNKVRESYNLHPKRNYCDIYVSNICNVSQRILIQICLFDISAVMISYLI